ncbi:unnamed protein product [Ceutorhynchus assimilis]|uniref:Gustatory receptor n=1 Tax=Ceutorhynchus assimilis TaxID=467358 RepID=A0A9N9MSX9_9CUCU|nr:unnamed protein product [Ceutorhynchus assimilis]
MPPTPLILEKYDNILKKIHWVLVDYVAKDAASAYVAILFIDLARHWPKLMLKWREVEQDMEGYRFPKGLNRKIILLLISFTSMFLVEFGLHQASRIYRVIECQTDQDKAVDFFFGNLTLSHIFDHIPYNIPTSLMFQYWFLQIDFGFTYTDLFVMVISISLASRMTQVCNKIKLACQKQISNEQTWINLRRDYLRLESLCHLVNDQISNIILVSFLPNIFTILTRVYNSLKPKQNYLEDIYFYFSLAFLISRTVTVCICAALVHEESRKPLNILNSVPHNVYNNEIEVFINQLLHIEISMNGKHFFNIKRQLILKIAGAMVTYELVLIQFNQENLQSWSRSTRCA